MNYSHTLTSGSGTTPEFSWPLFDTVPIVGIIRNIAVRDILEMVPGYRSAGLTTLEITMNTPGATAIISQLSQEYAGTLNIGAGTVRNRRELDAALTAGAQFIVTPIIDEAVIRTSVAAGIPVFPGAYTPTEIYRAWDLGAAIVKVFPATRLGAAYFRELKGPLNEVRLMPTGGVSLETIPDFFRAGVSGFGIGSPLFPESLVAARDWGGLAQHFSAFVALLQQLRAAASL